MKKANGFWQYFFIVVFLIVFGGLLTLLNIKNLPPVLLVMGIVILVFSLTAQFMGQRAMGRFSPGDVLLFGVIAQTGLIIGLVLLIESLVIFTIRLFFPG